MPIFEYTCSRCGDEFEQIVVSKQSVVSCPECGHRKARKKISTFAVQGGAPKEKIEAGPCHCGAPQRGMCRNRN